MPTQALKAVVVVLAMLALPGARLAGQNEENGRPELRVGALNKQEIRLDGQLSEPGWAAAEAIENLATVEPEEGGDPAGRTIVKILADKDEIIVGAICYDPDASGIVAFSKARDAELEFEDRLTIVFDTFRDGRTGYVFAVNPNGARFDGLVSGQGEDVNSDWDTVWEAKTFRDNLGWSTEIRIPIKSLSFKRGLTSWGFNIERRVQRLQETSRWSAVSQDYEVGQTSRAGLITDLPEFDLGLGLSIRPGFTTRAQKASPDQERTYDVEPTLDVTQKIGPNLVASLTVNTDFAETEVDARQTNLSRFEVLFPEKRSFFLEGSDIFEFGVGLDEDLVPFFSRRVGLFFEGEGGDGIQIPIDVGGKLNGRIGNSNLGALAVRTRGVSGLDLDGATMGAFRLKQNIFSESTLGFIGTVGDQLGRSGAWMSGVDFIYQTSQFRGDKNLVIGVWGLLNNRDGLEGDKSAYGFEIDYPNDLWDIAVSSKRIGDGFDPSLGFVPRRSVHIWDAGAEFKPRPDWGFVRQMFYEVKLNWVNDLDYNLESYALTLKPFGWRLESGDLFEVGIVPEGDRPFEDFDVFETDDKTVVIPAGNYEWTRYFIGATLADKRRVSGELKWESGGYYGGELDTIEAALAFNWPLMTFELTGERNNGRLPFGDFIQNLYGGRVEMKISPDFQVSSFLQFDNESRSFGTNTRLRWTFSPLGDLFIVYNHNLQQSVNDRLRRWRFDSNELVIKLQYAWRF